MKEKYDVIILCGGKGTRLYPLTANIPKPMVKIGDLPVIEHIIRLYEFYKFHNIKLLVGYKGDIIQNYFEDRCTDKKMNIHCIETGEESDTAERIWQIRNKVSNTFFLSYSDVLADLNLDSMLEFHKKHGKVGTMATYPLTTSYGIVKFDDNRIAYEYLEKPIIDAFSINAGFFILNSTLFDYWGWSSTDFSKGMLFKLCRGGLIACYEHKGFWSGMDTVRENEILNEMWRTGEAKWAVWKK
jgi:glucose-1-phosphate cytidylyltransferase